MICAIVLAAGQSRRMGAHKLLLPLRGTTVIGHIVAQLLRSTVDKIFVVVGHKGEKVAEQMPEGAVSIVTNPNYQAGMLSSVRCGIEHLPQDCDAVLVVLGDQPSITSELVDEMVKSFAGTEEGVVVPVYQGKRGHPILFAERYCSEVSTCFDDVGLKGLLHAHPDEVFELEVASPGVLSDMDHPEDYKRELA
ncbi:MAG: nucleotidyltransferase family protein [Phycisphaerales bacterium]|nr:MAG: nucleotidyltransferase family protein [Phycisphaerales bacterium]